MFGSWEEIHPASLGAGSQEVQFWAREDTEEDTGEKLHPASFRASANTGTGPFPTRTTTTCVIVREDITEWWSRHIGRLWHANRYCRCHRVQKWHFLRRVGVRRVLSLQLIVLC